MKACRKAEKIEAAEQQLYDFITSANTPWSIEVSLIGGGTNRQALRATPIPYASLNLRGAPVSLR